MSCRFPFLLPARFGARGRSPGAGAQRGVSLLISMMVLLIIGFTSVAVMRNSLGSDVISINAKAQTQANQYAMAAQRFCELKLVSGSANVLAAREPEQWTTFAHWFPASSAKAYTLRREDLAMSAGGVVMPAAMPQCLIEQTLVGKVPAWIITARGFSADYSADVRGNTVSGAAVWLQAIVKI